VPHIWDIGTLLPGLCQDLPDSRRDLAQVLLAAINDPAQATALEQYALWSDTPAMALNAPWPEGRGNNASRVAAHMDHSYYTNNSHPRGLAMRVSTADFIKNYGDFADKALTEPVTITKNGRDRLVVLAVGEYERLKRRDRQVRRAEDLTEEELALIAAAKVPAEYAYLDDELKDWTP
jgi:PHD/YefM family antitoxin component YafN of YafNO toxin-antitoxin module